MSVNYTEHNSFVNPYNFVPVDFEETQRRAVTAVTAEQKLTGYIQCLMTARTPIAILDTDPDPDKVSGDESVAGHKHYSFMADGGGNPIIAGSSIRGMVRNVFETLTDSCFSTMPQDSKITARSKGAFKPGVLERDENGEWKLYKADKYMLKVKSGSCQARNSDNEEIWNEKMCLVYKTRWDADLQERCISLQDAKLKSGDKVSFTILKDQHGESIQYKKGTFSCGEVASRITPYEGKGKEGYLVIGEDIKNKHHESIFVKGEEVEIGPDKIGSSIEGLEMVYKQYNNASVNKNLNSQSDPKHYGYPAYKRMKEQGLIPIWYNIRKDRLYLSLAAIGRMSYKKTLNDLVSVKSPCVKRDELCPACRLFGMVGESSVGSMVRFTDAHCLTPEKIGEKKTLAELAQPRTSYMPFYSNATDSDYKNRQTPGYDDAERQIRGRKFYWHSNKFDDLNRDVEETERNSTVEVAEAGSQFAFKVYFDSITGGELQQLVYALNFYENTEGGDLCHKIGHGKPIGLGSVKIYVSEIKHREFVDGEYCVKEYEGINYECAPQGIDKESETVKALLKICDFKNQFDNISYPYIADKEGKVCRDTDDNNLASHRWFTENTSSRLGGRNRSVQILPQILDRSQELESYKANIKAKGEVSAGYQVGEVYSGTVKRYNPQKTSAYITLDTGGTASLYYRALNVEAGKIDEALPIGRAVRVKYAGKNRNGYDTWVMQ